MSTPHEMAAKATRFVSTQRLRRAAGVRLGWPRRCPDDVLALVLMLRAGGALVDIASALDDDGVLTPGGGGAVVAVACLSTPGYTGREWAGARSVGRRVYRCLEVGLVEAGVPHWTACGGAQLLTKASGGVVPAERLDLGAP